MSIKIKENKRIQTVDLGILKIKIVNSLKISELALLKWIKYNKCIKDKLKKLIVSTGMGCGWNT